MVGIGEIARAAVSAVPTSTAHVSNVGRAGGAPFETMLRTMVSEGSNLQAKADQAVTGLLDGSGVELHQAMIATQKADMAFELALQVRNKAIAAYQQMMSMQF